MGKSKLKLFLENIIVYGFGGIISKVVPLIMVPILTYIFPNTSFLGLSDNANTVLQFGSALAIMGMYDAMYRLFFEKEDEQYKKEVCSTTFIFTFFTSLIVAVFLLVLKDIISPIVFEKREYAFLMNIICVTTFVSATNGIISAPTRMQNKRNVFLVTNAITPILSYSISLPLILNGHYVVAMPLAALIAGLIMEISFFVMNHRWFSIRLFRKDLLKPLLTIAIPLLPNFLIYWVFNSSDKLMITNILGMESNGIYSVGAKIGMCSQLIYTAFTGGWQYFAFSTMKEKDQVENNSAVFEYLGAVSFAASVFLCALSSFIFKTVFAEAYYSGFIVAPYLFLAPLLLMLFQVACNQFIVIKKTWPNMFILSSGAILNVVLNLVLIPRLGIEGASIATLCGYVLTDTIVCIVLIRMKLMVLNKRFYIMTLGIVLYYLIWRLFLAEKTVVSLIIAVIYALLIVFLYRKEIRIIINKIKESKKVHNDKTQEA